MNLKDNYPDKKVIILIIVAALGYFVDIYDMVLFGVVKAESLSQIMSGYSPEEQASTGKFLSNCTSIEPVGEILDPDPSFGPYIRNIKFLF